MKALSPSYRTDITSAPDVSSEQPIKLPGITDRIMKGVQDRIHTVLEKNPITKAARYIKNTISRVKKSVWGIMGWKSEKTKESPSPDISATASTTQSQPPALPQPEVKPEPEFPFDKAQEEYEKLLHQKEGLIADDMAVISAQISRETHGPNKTLQRNTDLDKIAQQRIHDLDAATSQDPEKRKTKNPLQPDGFEHSAAILERDHCVSENILHGSSEDLPNAASMMKAFMDSFEHRKQLKGTYEEFGIAVRYLEEQKRYYAVMVYRNGQQAVAKSEADLPATPLPSGPPDSSSQIALLAPYREALEEAAGLQHDIAIEFFEDKGLKLVNTKTSFKEHYAFLENSLSPLLSRKNGDGKIETIAIKDVFEDFQKMEKAKNQGSSSDSPLEKGMAKLH